MPTATPESLVTVLTGVLELAADKLRKDFDDHLDRIEQDADQGWAQIVDTVKHPAWSNYLLYLLVRIRDLDPSHMEAGTRQTPHGRLLTLTYLPEPPNNLALTLGLGITDPKVEDGLLIEATGAGSTGLAAGGLRVRVDATAADGAAVSWWLPFGRAPALPDQGAVLDVTASWTLAPQGAGIDEVKVGPLYVHGHLTTAGTPGYELVAGLGDGKTEGIAVDLNFADRLGAVGKVVSIAPLDDAYSPNVRIASGLAPTFSLGQRGPRVRGV